MYTIWERRHGLPSLVPVTDIQVKAQIARPAPFEVVPKGKTYRMYGAAWAGRVGRGEGRGQRRRRQDLGQAKLLGKPVRFAWRFWEYDWRTPGTGPRVLMARATDSRGRTQPMERDPDRRDAVISHVLPIEVEIV